MPPEICSAHGLQRGTDSVRLLNPVKPVDVDTCGNDYLGEIPVTKFNCSTDK